MDKTYYARIDGKVDEEDQRAFLQGVDIGDETKTAPAKLEILKSADISEILLTIQEGRFHQVKRMFQARDNEGKISRKVGLTDCGNDFQTCSRNRYRKIKDKYIC